MPRVKFTGDFSYKPTSRITIDYKAGHELIVKRECADLAIAAGKAKEIKTKGEADGEPVD